MADAVIKAGKFAKQWGPLWRCRGIGHNFIFPHCYIFLHSLVSFHYRETCGWIPIELIHYRTVFLSDFEMVV